MCLVKIRILEYRIDRKFFLSQINIIRNMSRTACTEISNKLLKSNVVYCKYFSILRARQLDSSPSSIWKRSSVVRSLLCPLQTIGISHLMEKERMAVYNNILHPTIFFLTLHRIIYAHSSNILQFLSCVPNLRLSKYILIVIN